MDAQYDLLIVGGGPAGLSAALNVVARGGSCAVLTNPPEQNPLWSAERVDNYSGMVGVSGRDMLTTMTREAQDAGAVFIHGRVSAILPFGGVFSVTVNDQIVSGRRLLLAIGATAGKLLPNEEKYLGRGLSYCATCDGRLYRGRHVIVTGNAVDIEEEVSFLRSIDVIVTAIRSQNIALWEENDRLAGLIVDGENVSADGVFILRQVSAPTALLAGLKTKGKFIVTDEQMRTNIAGCYAAGDCTGRPLQIAKAVGQGLIAAQHAINSIQDENKQKSERK